MADESQERTEQATEKRMKEVRQKGKLQKSQDVTAWLGVGAAVIAIPTTIDTGIRLLQEQFQAVTAAAASPEPARAVVALGNGLSSVLPILGVLLAAVVGATLVGAAAQGGIQIKKFEAKFEQFNIVNGAKRVFGTQALWQGVKSLAKTAVVGIVLYTVIMNLVPVFTAAGALPVEQLVTAGHDGLSTLLTLAVASGIALAAADVFVVMKRNRKQTRMTKKEVKDENKNSDGDPLVKSQRRSRQLAMSRNRMISAIGDADVVIVNPTHVAVALAYTPGRSAPRIVAKGKGIIAARIREEAAKERVPMVQDVPLARALHRKCELGQEIPLELYTAVAQVLAFVAALKARGNGNGVHRMSKPTPVPEGIE